MDKKKLILNVREKIKDYKIIETGNKLLDQAVYTGINFIITVIVTITFLIICKAAWHLYISLPVGKRYITAFAVNSRTIDAVLNQDLISFAISLSVTALLICLIIGTISRVLHINRYLFYAMSLPVKILFWGGSLTALVAYRVQTVCEYEVYKIIFIFAAVPTLCIFNQCFKNVQALVPELGSLLNISIIKKARENGFYFYQIKTRLNNIIDRINR